MLVIVEESTNQDEYTDIIKSWQKPITVAVDDVMNVVTLVLLITNMITISK